MQVTLKAARVNRNIPQKDAAKAVGVSPRTLRSYESGKAAPTAPILQKLMALYGCPFDDLIFCEKITPKS